MAAQVDAYAAGATCRLHGGEKKDFTDAFTGREGRLAYHVNAKQAAATDPMW